MELETRHIVMVFWSRLAKRIDDWMGVTPGMGLPIALLAFAVLMQWVVLGITLAKRFGLLS